MTGSDRGRAGTARDRRRWDELLARLRPQLSAGAKLTGEESLATKTTMRVGGAARAWVSTGAAFADCNPCAPRHQWCMNCELGGSWGAQPWY